MSDANLSPLQVDFLRCWFAHCKDFFLVNKICAVVSRSEPRDFVDVWFLCQQGYDRMEALRLSSRKDGVGPDTLLWILRDLKWEHFRVPDLPDEVVRETVGFFQEWMEELALDLHPGP